MSQYFTNNNHYPPYESQRMYTPGASQPYAPGGPVPPPPEAGGYGYGYNGDVKNPYEGERFKPKKRIRDPVFLILFIAQVRFGLSLLV